MGQDLDHASPGVGAEVCVWGIPGKTQQHVPPAVSCEKHWGRFFLCTCDGIRSETEMREALFRSSPSLCRFEESRAAVRRNIPIPYGCSL